MTNSRGTSRGPAVEKHWYRSLGGPQGRR